MQGRWGARIPAGVNTSGRKADGWCGWCGNWIGRCRSRRGPPIIGICSTIVSFPYPIVKSSRVLHRHIATILLVLGSGGDIPRKAWRCISNPHPTDFIHQCLDKVGMRWHRNRGAAEQSWFGVGISWSLVIGVLVVLRSPSWPGTVLPGVSSDFV